MADQQRKRRLDQERLQQRRPNNGNNHDDDNNLNNSNENAINNPYHLHHQMPSSPVNGGGSLPFFSDVDQLPLGTEPDPMPFEDDEDERDELAELANLDLLPDDDEDDDGEDLFGSDMARDYLENNDRDKYDIKDLDDVDYDGIDESTRQLVEAKLRRRDREAARREGRLPAAFMDDEDDDLLNQRGFQVRRRRKADDDDLDGMIDDLDGVPELPDDELLNVKGRLSDWIQNSGPRLLIRKTFKQFLTSFVDDNGESVYGARIKFMCEKNLESLPVSYTHLQLHSAILAYYLSNCPAEILKIFDEVAFDVVLDVFDSYDVVKPEIHVRITDLPVCETLRDLRQFHLNTLVRVSGVVTKRSSVFPQLKYVKYDCIKCGALIGPFFQESSREISVGNCPSCASKGPFNVNSEQTIYRNYQRLTLQETPGTVPAGRLPRHREVILLWDLVDAARPGEEIEVTGIYQNNFDITLNSKNGFPVFATLIEANHIHKKEDMFASFKLTEEDVKEIVALSKDPNIIHRITKSIAPSIYGHEDIKRAIALSMFGGVAKNPQRKHRVRGDINILMLGDPGTAKSQFLKYVEKTAHRAVYATGQGASAVGLTAAVHKDPMTREWTLEGGALVMADKGICMIDEFDKMNDQDRTSIHEAMEQQSISISKAGIITTLQARCAVIAAANPIRGRYNPQIPFSANVELTEPILSRFDILCVVRDTCNPVVDEHLARFVCNSHMRSHPNYREDDVEIAAAAVDKDIIPQDLLKKYVMYARERVIPRITNTDEEKLATFYADLRKESLSSGAIPITVRYLESMIRMAESFAKMELRNYVRESDLDRAISVMVKSFVSTQKIGAQRSLEKYLKKYMSFAEDREELLNHILSEMMNDEWKFHYYNRNQKIPSHLEVDCDSFEKRVAEYDINDVQTFYECKLFRDSYIFDVKRRKLLKSTLTPGNMGL